MGLNQSPGVGCGLQPRWPAAGLPLTRMVATTRAELARVQLEGTDARSTQHALRQASVRSLSMWGLPWAPVH